MEAEPSPQRPIENRGELLAALTRDLIAIHKRHYGRGATRSRAIFAHRNLLLVEMEDSFLTLEHTMVEKGQTDLVRNARATFQQVMRDEFIATVEGLTGRTVESYESVIFLGPNRILEIFYFVPDGGSAMSPGSLTIETGDGQEEEEEEIEEEPPAE